ncbi:MAG: ESPR domain-containing protein [Veillonella sp.]|uniref:ESPR domain-containing protein n=1 Tax=Veillonella sp. TaxID=1926307 RepID=UPI0025D174E5|nr:ESPR domain-containing protein [Veillonella sp.]MBS4913510.1 ESPR domain-containing protein [Veillonella sp.]
MNKQYKVIWSKVKNSYVVVSELAKQNGKSSSTHSKFGQKIGVALAVLALSIGATGLVSAANNADGSGSGVAVGSGSSASDAASVALGDGATVNVAGGVALGSSSVANISSNQIGYIPSATTFDRTEIFSPTWRSSLGAVSVGFQTAGQSALVT